MVVRYYVRIQIGLTSPKGIVLSAPRLPDQLAPTPVDTHTTACAKTRTVVHRIPPRQRVLRTLGLAAGGAMFALAGIAVLLAGDIPGATPVDGADPRWFGLAATSVGMAMVWIGWSSHSDLGWAIGPDGVVAGGRTIGWDHIGWFGIVTELRRSDRRSWTVWKVALRDDTHGVVSVSHAVRADPERIDGLIRTVTASWLIGAAPSSVPCVIVPPDGERQQTVGGYLSDAWEAVRSGRWTEIHDLDHFDNAAVLGEDLHGRGLDHLDEVAPAARTVLDRELERRGVQVRVGRLPLRFGRRRH